MDGASSGVDVVVVGGGHAGIEAAAAAARMRPKWDVVLVTPDPGRIGVMSCNPAIGGLAKGQIVRELDALGGVMPRIADTTGIQFRLLNASRGPAVQGPRCQSDKYAYAEAAQAALRQTPNLRVLPGTVEAFLLAAGRCEGVRLAGGGVVEAGAVVLTTGTFMRGLMHTGPQQTRGGRVGEAAASGISATLRGLGLELGRLKTGTPPRLDGRTIDWAGLETQPGDVPPRPFHTQHARQAADAGRHWTPPLRQVPCHLTHTSTAVHDLIRAHLDEAPMFNGQIETAGPRYCPSIEDKVVRFADRSSHHVFLEPESLRTDEIYCNGISTSLPLHVQQRLVRMLPGLERAEVLQAGYAVEYDTVLPHQIDSTGMVKSVPGLLLAGQINGTSGYEEAAAQGLIAGVNAVLWVEARRGDRGFEPLRLRRDQAYMGVLMDDLVTKTPTEPYRMFTSRAEHRLSLRSDNAAARLTPLGRDLGLVLDAEWAAFQADAAALAWWSAAMPSVPMEQPDEVDIKGAAAGLDPADLSHRPDLRAYLFAEALYAGYIERDLRRAARLAEREDQPLPIGFDYAGVQGLRSEAAQVLSRFQPTTLGQAGRLAGVNPADVMLLDIKIGAAS